MDPIRILITGGTFDKEYDERAGNLYFQDTHVPEMLRLARSALEVEVRTLMMVDSLDMSDADRANILITHGTDRMEVTARLLGPSIRDKTVVLTGAMVPYKFGSSDGLFNLGAALAFVQVLPPGVYVVMNGRALPWNRVRKNTKTGMFEEIEP
jgi:L-asparaginase